MFKLKSIYIKIKRNHIEVTDLNTGETVSKQAIQPFPAQEMLSAVLIRQMKPFNRHYKNLD